MSRLVPKLRFKEFSGEWEEKKLGEICKFQQGIQVDLDLQLKKPQKDYIRFLRIENYTQQSKDFRYIPLKLSKNKTISKNEIAIVRYGATAGYIGTGFNGVIANNLFKLLPQNILNNQYLYHFLKLEKTFKFFQEEMSGGAMPALNFNIVGSLSIPLPPDKNQKEQQKIANTLSSLDALIEAQNQKVEALKKHKIGLMQQLFPSEGERVPKLRFKEFSGEWEEKQLKDITTAIFDGTHQTPKYTDDGVAFFSVENLISGKANKFISYDDYTKATSKNKPEKNDILLTRIGNIGFSKVVDWDYPFSIYVTLAVIKQSKLFNSYYLNFYFQSHRYQTEIISKSLLSAVPCKINMDELRKTYVLLPKDKEQQKIANTLSSLDALIDAQNQKVEALKEHKKGLMQQMFVSGEG